MKKLTYAIAIGLAFMSVSSASQEIASSSTKLLTTESSALLWQANQASQPIQLANDPVIPSATQAATPVPTTAKTTCKGVATRATPPVPNYPSHIRNVVWRNVRAMCLEEIAHQNSTQPTNQH